LILNCPNNPTGVKCTSAELAALAAAEAGETIDEAFIRRYCPDSVEAIRRVTDWAAG